MKPLHVIISIVFLIAATLVVTRSERAVRSIQGGYLTLVSPLVKSGSEFDQHIKLFHKEVQSSKALEQRLEAIETDYYLLQAHKARSMQEAEENIRLREAHDFKARQQSTLVSTRVLTRTPSAWWETITINKGAKSSIEPQNPIISEHGLVGKVDRVWEDMATVLLITDESCLVAAKIESTPDSPAYEGIVSGVRGEYGEEALLKLKYLTKDISTEVGTRVFTSGKGGVFPDNIEIGTILSIEKGPLYAEAILKPSFGASQMDLAFVILQEEEQ